MTRAQILRKKTGIVLAIIGIVLSLLPAVRMADGSKLFIFQIIGNEAFFNMDIVAENPGPILTGILLSVVLIYMVKKNRKNLHWSNGFKLGIFPCFVRFYDNLCICKLRIRKSCINDSIYNLADSSTSDNFR